MIQELFGGTGLNNIAAAAGGEKKISSIHGTTSSSPSLSPSPSPSSSTTKTTTTTTTTNAATATNSENLRCPRCDSANTKFCYYNNYNLTQPRHFCKTCRRYWTKGGALRNVPIGGGCRKNKSVTVSTSVAGKVAVAGKLKTVASEIGRLGFGGGGGGGFDHEVQGSPILWGSPQNSHLLALLRASTQNPNPNPNINPLCNSSVKEEGGMNIGSHMLTESTAAGAAANGGMTNRTLGLDIPLSLQQANPSLGLCSSFWRNNSNNQNIQNQPPHHQQQQNGNFMGGHEVQSSGIQELFQRLRSSSSASTYYSDVHHSAGVLASSSSTSSILESVPQVVGGHEMGYWNNPAAFTWSDLSTTNGAYP